MSNPDPMRRGLLKGLGSLGCSAAAFPLLTEVAFARAPWEGRLVVIVLRGAMDGLDVVRPVGDPDFAALRPGFGTETACRSTAFSGCIPRSRTSCRFGGRGSWGSRMPSPPRTGMNAAISTGRTCLRPARPMRADRGRCVTAG
jgi:hypothetical protein